MGKRRSNRGDWRQRFKQALRERFLLRFHMFLITAAVLLSGVVASKLLWSFGLRSIQVRYPLAVGLSYGVFFVLIRIWLWYVSLADSPEGADVDGEDVADAIDAGADLIGSPGGPSFSMGSSGAGKGDSGFDLGDIGGGDGEGVVLILLGVVLLVVFGSSLYVIWEAPTVLGEAAFQMVLAGSLRRAARRIDSPGWAGSVLGTTWIPFALVLLITTAFAIVAANYCPGATRLPEILHQCKTHA
jgi:hypothetical protein